MADYIHNDSDVDGLLNDTELVERVLKDLEMGENDRRSLIIWGVSCVSFTLFVFLVCTVAYARKIFSTSKRRKLAKLQREERRKAKEERHLQAVSDDPIPAELFLKELHKRRKKGVMALEFKALSQTSADSAPLSAALLPNRVKNTSPLVLPYDHCRVTLECLANDAHSDYINASYIDSCTAPNTYIATQGPNRHTVHDFWRMVWQKNCRCIVMATNVFEHARQQCEKYWHNQHGRYGDIDVWLERTDILAEFNVRTFKICKAGETEYRYVKQFQYSSWSDHDCPNTSALLEYRRRVRAFHKANGGPLVVHCGSGAGRTGAFIAIDAVLEQVSSLKNINIFKFVCYMRQCRQNMVKTLQQYEFIYDCVAMFLQCGVTVIHATELPRVVRKLTCKNNRSSTSVLEREYRTLKAVVPPLTVGECAGGHRAENRRKSRDVMIQPPERARPYLITHDSNDSTDYINAVYVDGYHHCNAYIVTQWPLSSTVHDVWRLVYDYNIPTLVLLNDTSFSRSFPRFWPVEIGESVRYGPLTVELVDSDLEDEHISSRLFRIRKTLVSLQAIASGGEESSRVVRLFQLHCWPNNQATPSPSTPLIDLLTRVEDWQVKQCHGRIPTCVISKDGVTRCGIYCAINIAWDKLKAEGEVDIFRSVKIVKMNRPQLVTSLVEYVYCYAFIVVLLEILSATRPNLLPVNQRVEEDTWEQQEKPLILPHGRPKGEQSSRSQPSHQGAYDNRAYIPNQSHYPGGDRGDDVIASQYRPSTIAEHVPELMLRDDFADGPSLYTTLHDKADSDLILSVKL